MQSDPLPETLTLDEAYRSAFYLVLAYFKRVAHQQRLELVELVQYLWTDAAR
jgi:hypothetical protein